MVAAGVGVADAKSPKSPPVEAAVKAGNGVAGMAIDMDIEMGVAASVSCWGVFVATEIESKGSGSPTPFPVREQERHALRRVWW